MWNRLDYDKDDAGTGVSGRVTMGIAMILGRYAYCLKWANTRIVRQAQHG